jgi:predicted O-methyltransferase YrrM
MALFRTLKHALRDHAPPLYRPAMVPMRLAAALRHTCAGTGRALAWSLSSREDTNFTYELTPGNLNVLAQLLAVVTGRSPHDCRARIDEVSQDQALRRHIVDTVQVSRFRGHSDAEARFARRLGWYALVRLLRPQVVVETGVDKGLGSVLLCSALLRNRDEGHPGRYYGTDINPEAGWLLSGRYAETGRILYGDSIASLQALDERIDVFINDSDHSAEYEAREYEVIMTKLSSGAVLLSDNAHVSDALERHSHRHGRSYLYFHEQPLNHWYRGAGIGFSFVPRSTDSGAP